MGGKLPLIVLCMSHWPSVINAPLRDQSHNATELCHSLKTGRAIAVPTGKRRVVTAQIVDRKYLLKNRKVNQISPRP